MSRNERRFRSIVVPVDGSRLAEQALPFALAIAERAQSKVKLVLVHRQMHHALLESTGEFARTELAIHQSERNYLKDLLGAVRKGLGRAVSSAALKGPVATALAEYVRDVGADLVVMTTHGQGGVRRAWLGSVADQLIRSVEVPVLLVRATEGEPHQAAVDLGEILVPLDGSPLAEAALAPATALARLWDSEISLIQVVPPVVRYGDAALTFPLGFDDRFSEVRRDAAQDYLHDIAEHLRETGIKASGVAVLGGGVAGTLLDLADPKRIGVVVIATHGRGGARRLVLGSVADKIVRGAEVPVLVIRPANRGAKPVSAETRMQDYVDATT